MLDANHESQMGVGPVDPTDPSIKSYSNLYLEGSPVRKHDNAYFHMKEKIKNINNKYVTHSPTANSARKKGATNPVEPSTLSALGSISTKLNADLPPAPSVTEIIFNNGNIPLPNSIKLKPSPLNNAQIEMYDEEEY